MITCSVWDLSAIQPLYFYIRPQKHRSLTANTRTLYWYPTLHLSLPTSFFFFFLPASLWNQILGKKEYTWLYGFLHFLFLLTAIWFLAPTIPLNLLRWLKLQMFFQLSSPIDTFQSFSYLFLGLPTTWLPCLSGSLGSSSTFPLNFMFSLDLSLGPPLSPLLH